MSRSNPIALLWDADYICYRHKVEDSLSEAIRKVDEHINWILEFSNADYFCLFISEGKYFRHELTKDKSTNKTMYKSNRAYGVLPWVKCIKEYLKSKYGAVSTAGAEADDTVVFFNTKNIIIEYTPNHPEGIMSYRENHSDADLDNFDVFPVETTIIATDKDILGNCVGTHINPSKKNKELGEWETVWHTTDVNQSKLHFWTQMLIGDTVDCIMGCGQKVIKEYKTGAKKGVSYYAREGISLKPAKELFSSWDFVDECFLYQVVFDEYIQMFGISQGIFEFQKNYRLLHMLDSNKDMMQELGFIPELPKFQQVIKPEININEINF